MAQSLRDIFKDIASSSAFQVADDGELRLVGKFAEITVMGDLLDIWLVRPDREPIGTKKLNNIIANLGLTGGSVRMLTGEAIIAMSPGSITREMLRSLGIKQKKLYSDGYLAKLRENMAKISRRGND